MSAELREKLRADIDRIAELAARKVYERGDWDIPFEESGAGKADKAAIAAVLISELQPLIESSLQAALAVAYEDAAKIADTVVRGYSLYTYAHGRAEAAEEIRQRTPADAAIALDQLKQQVRLEARLDEAKLWARITDPAEKTTLADVAWTMTRVAELEKALDKPSTANVDGNGCPEIFKQPWGKPSTAEGKVKNE